MISIRRAGEHDAAFLQEMLAVAADWRPNAPRRTAAQVMADPSLSRYIDGWPREGDMGMIAEADEPVGAAWWRMFSPAEPGYGFVAPAIPEVSVGVREGWRRQGIGETLLRTLVDHARAEAVEGLSLSVEPDNGAIRLYERLGFAVVGRSGGAVTMLLA